MALPAVAGAAARVLAGAGRGLARGARAIPRRFGAQLVKETPEDSKPDRLSAEGIIWLLIAGLFDGANIIFAILDIVFGIGTVLAIIANFIAMLLVGSWLYFRTGQLPILKGTLPFGLNSLPIVRFIPFWVISVWISTK